LYNPDGRTKGVAFTPHIITRKGAALHSKNKKKYTHGRGNNISKEYRQSRTDKKDSDKERKS
jgi:hypothetical protein